MTIIQDAQFFQDATTEYQLTYQSLDEKYTHQAILVKEASEALKDLGKPCIFATGRVDGSEM